MHAFSKGTERSHTPSPDIRRWPGHGNIHEDCHYLPIVSRLSPYSRPRRRTFRLVLRQPRRDQDLPSPGVSYRVGRFTRSWINFQNRIGFWLTRGRCMILTLVMFWKNGALHAAAPYSHSWCRCLPPVRWTVKGSER